MFCCYDITIIIIIIIIISNIIPDESGLELLSGVCCKVKTTAEVVSYMKESFTLGEPGKVKGVKHPDGRIDDDD